MRHDGSLFIILAHTLVHKTQPIVQLCRALVFFELIDIPISVRHSGQGNRFKAILRHAVKRIQLFHRAEFLLQIFAVSCTAVFAEAILNGAVTDLVPGVPKDQIFAPRITLGYLFNKSLGSRLHVGIGKARTPAAVKRTVRAAAKLLTARANTRALEFFKHVLGGTFQQELDDDLAVILLGKIHQPIHVGKIVNTLLTLIPTPVDANLEGIQMSVTESGNIPFPFLGQRGGRTVILRTVNDFIKKHKIRPFFKAAKSGSSALARFPHLFFKKCIFSHAYYTLPCLFCQGEGIQKGACAPFYIYKIIQIRPLLPSLMIFSSVSPILVREASGICSSFACKPSLTSS